jgi:limonene-1,2-epoxide hydrolase
METPIEVVRRFCAAWSDNVEAAELAAFFTDDAVYQNIPFEAVAGRDAIADNIDSFVRPGPPGIESIDFRVMNIAANGPVVMTERVDVFRLPDKSFELPVVTCRRRSFPEYAALSSARDAVTRLASPACSSLSVARPPPSPWRG